MFAFEMIIVFMGSTVWPNQSSNQSILDFDFIPTSRCDHFAHILPIDLRISWALSLVGFLSSYVTIFSWVGLLVRDPTPTISPPSLSKCYFNSEDFNTLMSKDCARDLSDFPPKSCHTFDFGTVHIYPRDICHHYDRILIFYD